MELIKRRGFLLHDEVKLPSKCDGRGDKIDARPKVWLSRPSFA